MYLFTDTKISNDYIITTYLKNFLPLILMPAAYTCLFSSVLGPLDPESIVKAEVQYPSDPR